MSRGKNVSPWRDGKVVWRLRLYMPQELVKAIKRRALEDERDVSYILMQAAEKYVRGVGEKEIV